MAAESARVALRCEEAKQSKKLDLSECGLRKFPDSVFFLVRDTPLQALSLASNDLTRIPAKLPTKMPTITDLDLSHNQLNRLPNELHQLSLLVKLDISHNQLTTLPETIRELPALEELNAAHNLITAATPDEMTASPSLQTVVLSGNPLEDDVKAVLSSVVRITIIID